MKTPREIAREAIELRDNPDIEDDWGPFINFAADNIKKIAEGYLLLEEAQGYVISLSLHESRMKELEQENQRLREALIKAKEMNDHIFDTKKKPVNWGATFVDWGLMNDALLAVDKALKGGG